MREKSRAHDLIFWSMKIMYSNSVSHFVDLTCFHPRVSKWIAFRLSCLTVHPYFWVLNSRDSRVETRTSRNCLLPETSIASSRHGGFRRYVTSTLRLYRSMSMLPRGRNRKRLDDRWRRKQRRLASPFTFQIASGGHRRRRRKEELAPSLPPTTTDPHVRNRPWTYTCFYSAKDKRWPHKRWAEREKWDHVCFACQWKIHVQGDDGQDKGAWPCMAVRIQRCPLKGE
jgi:hypothetical protein